MFSECFGEHVLFLFRADTNTLDNSKVCNKKRELEHASQVLNFLDWKTQAETIFYRYSYTNGTTIEYSLTVSNLLQK